MHLPPHIALRCGDAATSLASLGPVLVLVAALAFGGCGSAAQSPAAASALLHGTGRTPSLLADLAPAARLARRFADSYARNVYRRRAPRLPGATAALQRRLAIAASRVPAARRELRPRALGLVLEPRGSRTLRGSVEIGDGRSPPFSVGFTLKRRGPQWRVVAISAPG